jgi:hypothetical protein
MMEATVTEWRFNSRGRLIWRSQADFTDIIDFPIEGPPARIDSIIAILDKPLGPGIQDTRTDRVCTVRMIRMDCGNIEFRFDPPDITFAYRRRVGDESTIIGDAGLWLDTFMMEEC